jgi:hypothetical protein
MAPLVEDLISLLTRCNQPIEPNLETLLDDYKNGLVDLRDEEEINDVNVV